MDNFVRLVGGELIYHSLAATDGYDDTHVIALMGNQLAQSKSFERVMAVHFMRQAERAKYGSILVKLTADKALGLSGDVDPFAGSKVS